MPNSKYTIAANAALADLEQKPIKLSASKQREIFGGYVFGKQTLVIDATNQGTVTASKQVIPCDTISAAFSFDQIAEAVAEGRKLKVS